ncbi:MAG: ATP-dependent RNA helicase RhlE [Candidatus Azotimanducaceae bacterium]|jgi:ATP-dependent RNA helicase RhlE
MKAFTKLGLSESLTQPLAQLGYSEATEIQELAIPPIIALRDVLASAQTGSGKTAAFVLPLLDKLQQTKPAKGRPIRVLCLAPTRELAQQIDDNVALYCGDLPLRHAVIYGGVPINQQIRKIGNGVDFLIATPGRLLDMLAQGKLDLSQVETLVLDEADRMLDLGFQDQIQQVLSKLPKQRQNLLFSATFNAQITSFTNGLLHDPIIVQAQRLNKAADNVKLIIYEVEQNEKPDIIYYLLANNKQQCLVFARTRRNADLADAYLREKGMSCAAIHSDKSQHQRTQTLQKFKNGEIQILVATDIAARGLDIEQLPLVINYDIPRHAEDYVHRVGRTGRAGMQGVAISLMGGDERRNIAAIEKLIQQQIFIAAIPYIDGENSFEYDGEIIASASSITERKITKISGISKRGKNTKPRKHSS